MSQEIFSQAVRLHQQGDLEGAGRLYLQLLKQGGRDDFEIRYILAFLRYQQSRHIEALQLVEAALAQKPNATKALILCGTLLQVTGRSADALDRFTVAAGHEPGNVEIWFNRGVVLAELGRHDEAIGSFDRALAIRPTSDGWNNRGASLQSLKRWREALDSFNAALSLKPDYAPVWVNRGSVLQSLERFAEALNSYDRALAIAPDSVSAWNERGVALLELKQFADALASFDRAIFLRPDFAPAWKNRGSVLQYLGRYEDALASYDRAIAIQPQIPGVFLNRGAALEKLGRNAEALANYDRALAQDPNVADAHLNRARLLCTKLGRAEDAIAGYDALLARQPGLAVGYWHRADAWRWISKPENALADLDSAIAMMPDTAQMRTHRGYALMDLKRFEEAMEEFDRATALNPSHSDAHYKKSFLLLLQGRFEEGWPLHEYRNMPLETSGPLLRRGDTLTGRTLFIQGEQGYGDILQFCRYAAVAQDMGAKVVMSVPDRLVRLFRGLIPAVDLVAASAAPEAFDVRVPVMSLPLFSAPRRTVFPLAFPILRLSPNLWRSGGVSLANMAFELDCAGRAIQKLVPRVPFLWRKSRRWRKSPACA